MTMYNINYAETDLYELYQIDPVLHDVIQNMFQKHKDNSTEKLESYHITNYMNEYKEDILFMAYKIKCQQFDSLEKQFIDLISMNIMPTLTNGDGNINDKED